MAASTLLPDGARIQWHGDLSECRRSAGDRPCPAPHLSKAELFADLDAEAAS